MSHSAIISFAVRIDPAVGDSELTTCRVGCVVTTQTLPTFHALDERVQESMQRWSVPGVAVGILLDGQEHTVGFGVTSIEHPLAVDADTLMQIGSITKTFTATAAMRLVEAGAVALDEPIRRYLPDLRLSSAEVTAGVSLKHLLTHTAGFVGDDFSDTGNGDDALARYVVGMAELPQLTPLGETWSYCNSGFCLAGRVIEVVTGKPYETALKELVLLPLGMQRAFLFPADVMTHRFAVGHTTPIGEPASVARPWPIPRASNAAGGITTSVKDLLRYARFHMGDGTNADGERLLSLEALRTMHNPLAPADGPDESVGVAWLLRDADGARVVRHAGGTNGQTSTLQLVPERNFAIAVFTNAGIGGELCREVVRWAMAEYLGLQDPEPAHLTVPRERLAEYAGAYDARMASVEISLTDDGLVVQPHPKGGFPTKDSPPSPAPPPTRVAFIGDDRIIALDPPFSRANGEFLRRPDGTLAWLRWGGRLAARQR